MKFNRIAIIAILAILTVVLAGSVSAFDLGFLTGGDSEPQEVTVGGIDFNIPATLLVLTTTCLLLVLKMIQEKKRFTS